MILDWHLGLGDAIICNGLVRKLAERNDSILLPTWTRNLPTVQAMFSDLLNVTAMPVNQEERYPGATAIGVNDPSFGSQGSFDQEFYRLAGVDFDCRWSAFKIPETEPQLEPPLGRFMLIHGTTSDGKKIDVSRILTDELWDVTWIPVESIPGRLTQCIKLIAAAEQIHCLDSAFVHLVESVPSSGALFFHDYARPNYFQRRKDWMVLN